MVIEGLRTDSLVIGDTGIRVSQLVAFCMVIAAVSVWLVIRAKLKRDPQALPLYVTTEESKRLMEPEKKAESKKAKQKSNEE